MAKIHKTKSFKNLDLLEEMVDHAHKRGRHETNDVRQALYFAWYAMTPTQRRRVYKNYNEYVATAVSKR